VATEGDTDADSAALLSASEAANKEGTVQDIVDNEVQAVANNQLSATQKNPPPIPNPEPTGDSTNVPITPAMLAAYLAGDDGAVGEFIDQSGSETNVTNAWDYFVDQIEDVFVGLEGSFDAVAATAVDVSVAVEVTEVAAGVTADIGGIEVVGFGVGLLLAQYCIGWVLQQVGQHFPDPNILGWRPLNFLQEGITTLGNDLAGAAENEAEYVINFVMQPIRVLTGLFQRIFNSHAAMHNQGADLRNNVIPNATAGLVAQSESYTDAKVETTLTQAENYANALRSDLESEIATAKADAEQAALTDATNVQTNLVNRLQGDEVTLAALSTEITTTIPNELETEINEATATENQQLTAATSTIEQQIAGLTAQINTLQGNVNVANATIATAEANITQLQSAENVDEDAIAQQQEVITTAQSDIATSTTAISDLYTQIEGISDTLAPIQATQQLQTNQISSINTDIDVGLPLALATISATLNTLKTDVDECMVDNCNTGNPNNIQNVLKDLLELFTAAAEIGFIAEAVRDPLGTAAALAPILDTLDTSAVDTLNLLLEL
jgi:hypothetical protein